MKKTYFERANVSLEDLNGNGSWMLRIVDDQGNQVYTQECALQPNELLLLYMAFGDFFKEYPV